MKKNKGLKNMTINDASDFWDENDFGEFDDIEEKKDIKFDDLVKSLLGRHPGESRGPEHLEITGFRLAPE